MTIDLNRSYLERVISEGVKNEFHKEREKRERRVFVSKHFPTDISPRFQKTYLRALTLIVRSSTSFVSFPPPP